MIIIAFSIIAINSEKGLLEIAKLELNFRIRYYIYDIYELKG